MLISDSIYMPLAIGLPILLGIGIIWLTYKKFKKFGLLAGILASAFGWAALQTAAGHFYIVRSANDFLDFRSFGSVEFSYSNGTSATFEYDPMKVHVINNTNDALMLEEVVYTSTPFTPESELFYIEPFDAGIYSLPYRKIDFFFDEEVPREIEEYGSGSKSKYWLHKE